MTAVVPEARVGAVAGPKAGPLENPTTAPSGARAAGAAVEVEAALQGGCDEGVVAAAPGGGHVIPADAAAPALDGGHAGVPVTIPPPVSTALPVVGMGAVVVTLPTEAPVAAATAVVALGVDSRGPGGPGIKVRWGG